MIAKKETLCSLDGVQNFDQGLSTLCYICISVGTVQKLLHR